MVHSPRFYFLTTVNMWQSLSSVGHHVHMAFGLMLLVGVVLFMRWAWLLKADELMKWAKKLIIIGALGAILTACFGGGMRMKKHKMMRGDGDMKMMMMDGKWHEKKMTGEKMDDTSEVNIKVEVTAE